MTRVATIGVAAAILIAAIGLGCGLPDLDGTVDGGVDTEAPKDSVDIDVSDTTSPDDTIVNDVPDSDGSGVDEVVEVAGEEAPPCEIGDFCDDKECGQDPCGGQCKTTCWAHQSCFAWRCREEGQLGFLCETDADCDSGHCVQWEDEQVCTVYCDNDNVCEDPDWSCEMVFDNTFCMPPCEAATCEELDALCGSPADGCYEVLDCGTCEGENETCGDEWVCVCAHQPCGDLCCGIGENCVAGGCWDGPIPCDPPCGDEETCSDLEDCIPCCKFGEYCSDEVACFDDLVCTNGTCCYSADADCDDVDDDCDGVADDDYIPDGTCGIGFCLATNTPSSCQAGVETICQPGAALDIDDTTCDGVDDDCDGDTNEDYVTDGSCGTGYCLDFNTPSSCVEGVETPCLAGPPLGDDDTTCDGNDDDCDGDTDEDYQTINDCGVGWCKTNNLPSACVDGFEIPCQPGDAGDDETTCNGVDDNCNGSTDEDYPVDDSCGVGLCLQFNTPSSCVGGVESLCAAGEAADDDTMCNGLDDDCDGDTDEDYLSDAACGKGWCLATNVASVCDAGLEVTCVPGQPLADQDVSCDSVDSDCDGLTDEDADPPCSLGAPVVGAHVVFLSDFGLPSGVVTDHGDGTYSTAIVDLIEPGLEGNVTAHLAEKISDPKGFTVVSGIPETTTFYLSQDLVYGDNPHVRGCLYTIDAFGAPAGPGFVAGFDLEVVDIAVSATATYTGAGFYCAWIDLPDEAFVTWGDTQVTGWIEALSTDPLFLTLAAAPVYTALDIGEVALTVPLGPVAVGQEFSVPVVVNTDMHSVSAYNLGVNFDTDILEVVSVDQGAAVDLSPPASNVETDANETGKLSFNAINQNPAGGTAQGEAVELAVITFAVRADATPGASGAISGDVYELVDTLMADFSASPDITVHGPDGSSILDEIHVDQVVLRAIQPVANPPTLLDLSFLTGEVPTGTIEVLAFRSDGSLSQVTDLEVPVCGVGDSDVAAEAGCQLTAAGAGITSVQASIGQLSGMAVLRVATLEIPLDAAPLDPALQYIFELDTVQTTRMRVLGTLSDGDLLDYTVDLTTEVGYQSSDEVVAEITDDGLITPGINGMVGIDVLGYYGAIVATSGVEVLSAEVHVDDLLVVVPAHVELASLVPEPVPAEAAAIMATAKVTNLLSGEGHQVQTRAILIFSDDEETDGGSRLDITGSDLLGYQSGIEGIGTVDPDGVITAVGAGVTDVYAVFKGVWGNADIDDTKPFSVELPPPIAVEVSAVDPRVAIGVEDRAWTVLGVPYQRLLLVDVFFEDGTILSLAQDPRAHYEVSSEILTVPGVIDCIGVPGCTPGVATATGAGAGSVSVTVTFPDCYLSDLVGTIDLEVVAHETLVLASQESHTPPESAPVTETILSLIEGTGIWQEAALYLVDTFSDGSQVILTEHPNSKYFVYLPGTDILATGIIQISNDGRISAQGAGIVNLVGEHQGETSEPIPLQVSGSPVNIIGLTSYLQDGTLAGIKDQGNETLMVLGLFSDGTRRLLSGSGLVPGLLAFNSMDLGIATINSAAVLTARGNGSTVVTVDITEAADIGVPFDPPSLSSILVNLEPTAGDVDLGEPVGHPFPDQPSDAIFEVPVRVNTGGFLLGGLDIEIEYDPDVLEGLGVVQGIGLPSSVFQWNTGEPGKIQINVSPMVSQVAFGDGLEVARIAFKAKKSLGGPMVSPIGGTIRGAVNTSGGPLGADTPRPIVAGHGEIDPPPVTVLGDANDDETFDIGDVLFLQWIVAVPPLWIPNQTQEAQSDVFPDGAVDMRDAYFASQVLARLAHFVHVEAISTAPGEYDLKAWVVDRDQELVSDYVAVSFEVLPGDNLEEIQFSQPYQQTSSGLITAATLQPDGSWGTHVSELISQEAMNLVVILETVDGIEQIMMATAFISSPHLDPDLPYTPIISFGDDWCVPDCDGLDCGDDDGCGGVCIGTCSGVNEVCHEGICICGWAQCAGLCCEQGEVCELGACCAPTTCWELGATCGTPQDGCGGVLSCGSCAPTQLCDDQSWSCECTYDECDGICCEGGEICMAGACTCVPDCEGKSCGDDDSCGAPCNGPCPMDQAFCHSGSCQCFHEACGYTCCGKYDACQDGACISICEPSCAGQLCEMDNGCGDPCDGECLGDNQFCQEGLCTCIYLQCGSQCCGDGDDCIGGECV